MKKAVEKNIDIVAYAEELNEEVKEIALNLAIYLAKRKKGSEQLSKMEPEFIRLVNSAVKVGQELSVIINAAKNKEKMVYDVPSGKMNSDQLETKLTSILSQCRQILDDLGVKNEFEI